MGIKIISAKVIGLCSKHRKKFDEIPKYKDGRIIEDKNIAYIEEDRKVWKEMGYEALYFELKEVKDNVLPIK